MPHRPKRMSVIVHLTKKKVDSWYLLTLVLYKSERRLCSAKLPSTVQIGIWNLKIYPISIIEHWLERAGNNQPQGRPHMTIL